MAKDNIKKYEMDMSSGSVLRKMLAFTIPLMFSGVLQLLFNAADIVIVGNFAGDDALAAVGSNTSLINLITNLFVGLSIGSNVLAAREYGAQQEGELSRTVHTSMLLGLTSGIALTAVGVLGARQILIWMQTPQSVLGLATVYLRIYFLGMTATMIYNFGSAVLRAVGDTKRPLYFLFISGVINVLLNLFFVLVLEMDVAGVAIATVISQCVSAALIVICLMKAEGGIHLSLPLMRFDWGKFAQILKIGLPAGFQGILFSLSNVVIQSAVNSFGAVVMAGNSAAANIEGFVYVAMNAFYQATLSFGSQSVGAGNIKRVTKILLTGQLCVVVVGIALGNITAISGNVLLRMYSADSAVIAAGAERLDVICTTYALCGMMDVMVGALRAIGYSVMPMIVSLVGVCAMRLAWIATVFQLEQFHIIKTVYASYPITWVITLVAHVICYIWAINRVKRRATAQTDTGIL